MELEPLREQLQAFAEAHYTRDAVVSGVEAMPGHAGLSFGFDVEWPGGDGVAHLERLVMRIPPKGVRLKDNTDVLKQVPLLQALKKIGVPVPTLRWWGDDLQWFEVPYFMVYRLPGATFNSGLLEDPSFDSSKEGYASVYRQAILALTQAHKLDWESELLGKHGWDGVVPLEDEIHKWDPIIAKAAEPWMVDMGNETRDILLETMPQDPPIGIFHGDFQGSNWLCTGNTLVALLDWEIAGLGGQLLDLGWICAFSDPESWHESRALTGVEPPIDELIATYEEGMGRKAVDINWYRALAGFRFGAITGFNTMLHRRGKRHDPGWETTVLSLEPLYRRAQEMART
jgi:aminoglycoside phosphotransferase (APT) family kinase protein